MRVVGRRKPLTGAGYELNVQILALHLTLHVAMWRFLQALSSEARNAWDLVSFAYQSRTLATHIPFSQEF